MLDVGPKRKHNPIAHLSTIHLLLLLAEYPDRSVENHSVLAVIVIRV